MFARDRNGIFPRRVVRRNEKKGLIKTEGVPAGKEKGKKRLARFFATGFSRERVAARKSEIEGTGENLVGWEGGKRAPAGRGVSRITGGITGGISRGAVHHN